MGKLFFPAGLGQIAHGLLHCSYLLKKRLACAVEGGLGIDILLGGTGRGGKEHLSKSVAVAGGELLGRGQKRLGGRVVLRPAGAVFLGLVHHFFRPPQ